MQNTPFDPYHKWLGIPPSNAPRNHYMLLRLQLFEGDTDAITNSAQRQLLQLQKFESGPYAAQAQIMIAEIGHATATLLDHRLKTAYDDKVRLELVGKRFGPYVRLRIRIRRLQQMFGMRTDAFFCLMIVFVVAVITLVAMAIARDFALAILSAMAFGAPIVAVVFDAYLAPNPGELRQLASRNKRRRLMWIAQFAVAELAALVLLARVTHAPATFLPIVLVSLGAFVVLALVATRVSSRPLVAAEVVHQVHAPENPIPLAVPSATVTGAIGSMSGKGISKRDTISPDEMPSLSQQAQLREREAKKPKPPPKIAPAAGTPKTDEFDPYYKWLGIPPHQRPPNHYQLVGVQMFEDDLDVIQNLSDQRLAQLKTFSTGKHGPLAEKLLTEVMQATLVLLNPAKKQEYDSRLRTMKPEVTRPDPYGQDDLFV